MTLLPQIRGGGESETKLDALFEACLASPFSHHRLSSWLNGKEREIEVLTQYLATLREVGSIGVAFAPGEIDSMIHNLDNEYILCYTFKIAGKHNSYFKKMLNYLRRGEAAKAEFEDSTPNSWLDNGELTSDMMLQARQFRSFAQANADRAGLQCVVADKSTGDITGNKGAVIVLYENGIPRPFEPPGQPGQPTEASVTHKSIELKWNKPKYGAQNVDFYTISYGRSLDDPPEQWVTQKTEGPQETLTVSGLTSDKVYYFKVCAECEVGTSVYSKVSRPINTSPRKSLAEQMCGKCGQPIENGPPRVYKLPVHEVPRDNEKRISRCCIGKPKRFMPTEKVLMVVGTVGAGKSTLINGMVNYILGVEWKDPFRFKLMTSELASKSQAHCQTNEITAYTLHQMQGSKVPYTLTIIDTPEFGDTKSSERNRKIASQIKEFLFIRGEGEIDHLDGICFVTQAAFVQLSPTQQYIFDLILYAFGKNNTSNIFRMITFADVNNADAIQVAESFKFNNSALFSIADSADVNDDDEDEDDDNFAEMWKMDSKSFESFFTKFQQVKSISLVLTEKVLENLEANMQRFQRNVQCFLSKISMLQQHKQQIVGAREAETAARKEPQREIERLLMAREVEIDARKEPQGEIAYVERKLERLYREILAMVQHAKASLNHLAETNSLTEVDYIELLIESETQQCEDGYQQRIQCYEEVKKTCCKGGRSALTKH